MSARLWLWKGGNPTYGSSVGTIFHPNFELVTKIQPDKATATGFVATYELGGETRLPGVYTMGTASMVVQYAVAPGYNVDIEATKVEDARDIYMAFLMGKIRPVETMGPQIGKARGFFSRLRSKNA